MVDAGNAGFPLALRQNQSGFGYDLFNQLCELLLLAWGGQVPRVRLYTGTPIQTGLFTESAEASTAAKAAAAAADS